MAENPLRTVDEPVAQVVSEAILNDVAYLHIGKIKGLHQVFQTLRFLDRPFEDFSIEIDDGAIGLECTGMNIAQRLVCPIELDLDVGVAAALFRKDLDTHLVIFMRSATIVIAIYFAEQNDRGRAWSFWLAGHL